MTTFGTKHGLFTIEQAKQAEHRRLLDDAQRHTCSGSAARATEVDRIRRELMEFLRVLGIGAHFQALDFTAHLANSNAMPDPAVFDARGIGGLYLSLCRAGLIAHHGAKPNGGCPARNINSAVRPIYVVRSLDFKAIGWEGDQP